jgi:hypothetical protein
MAGMATMPSWPTCPSRELGDLGICAHKDLSITRDGGGRG